MKLVSKTQMVSARWLALLTIFGMAVFLVPVFAQGQTVAGDDSAITPPETPVEINVVANDTPGSGKLDRAGVTVTIDPIHAANLTYDGKGTFTYTPNAEGLSDTFEYYICDIPSAADPVSCDYATVTIEIFPATAVPFKVIPKKLNMNKRGVIPAVIRGTEEILATMIDPDSILIKIDPESMDGVAPGRTKIPGHSNRLNLKFDAQDILLLIGEVTKGDVIVLYLTGNLLPAYGSTEILGQDMVVITGQPKHQ